MKAKTKNKQLHLTLLSDEAVAFMELLYKDHVPFLDEPLGQSLANGVFEELYMRIGLSVATGRVKGQQKYSFVLQHHQVELLQHMFFNATAITPYIRVVWERISSEIDRFLINL